MKIIKLAIISLMIVFCSFGIAYAFTFNKADDLRTNLAFELDAYAVFGDVSITNITIERDYEIGVSNEALTSCTRMRVHVSRQSAGARE